MFPWVVSRANLLYFVARILINRAAVCLHAAHIAALRAFWTDWYPGTETRSSITQHLEIRFDSEDENDDDSQHGHEEDNGYDAVRSRADSEFGARLPPKSAKSQSKPRFTRGISVICHFICFVSAYYARFLRITRDKVRVE